MRSAVAQRLGDVNKLSGGVRMWLSPPRATGDARTAQARIAFGTNVDANDPSHDTAAGQSETAIAAQTPGGGRRLVMAGGNDVSGFFSPVTTPQGSAAGVAISEDGGAHFRDLIGLPNNNIDQQWSGDPSIASLGDGVHFAVSSLYYPSAAACADGLPAQGTIAVSIATVRHTSTGPSTSFGAPVTVAAPGDLGARITGGDPSPNLATLDKDWISYDPTSRTLALSYTRFYFPLFTCTPTGCTSSGRSGNGQIEVVRAHVPADAAALATADFGAPVVVWREEAGCASGVHSSEATQCGAVDQGAYVALARGGTAYVAWERNVNTNLNGDDPYVYEHAAVIPPRSNFPSRGGRAHPVVISTGQAVGNASGGTKSLDAVAISGYSRGLGQDFPRLAVDTARGRAVFVRNDASRHPLGDIWLRTTRLDLSGAGTTRRVDDGSSYALRFLPAVSIRPTARSARPGTTAVSGAPARRSRTTGPTAGRRPAPTPSTPGSPPVRRTGPGRRR